jgi:hypothetical protein
VTGAEATSLFRLRCVWGDMYSVAFRDGVWSAYRLKGAAVLTANTAEELTVLMHSDLSTSLTAETP